MNVKQDYYTSNAPELHPDFYMTEEELQEYTFSGKVTAAQADKLHQEKAKIDRENKEKLDKFKATMLDLNPAAGVRVFVYDPQEIVPKYFTMLLLIMGIVVLS